MITNLVSRCSESPVARATGSGRVIPARVRPQTSQTYYHRNQQYSIVGLTNAAGTLVERYAYSAYGTLGIYAANGTVRSSSTYANRYTYTGREWDGELRLYHFRARWYDSATGGFVSRDPLGYVDGMSLYRGYFGVRGVDPSGSLLIADDGLWSGFDDTRVTDSTNGVRDRYVYTPQQIQRVDDKCTNNGWCFCATRAYVRSRSFKNERVGYELKWTIEGVWVRDTSFVRSELPRFRYFEWWDFRLQNQSLNPNNGEGRYEGRNPRMWHEFPVVATDSFFNGQAASVDAAADGKRNPENTGITPCAIYDHCQGNYALDKSTNKPANLPTALTFMDHPGMNWRNATGPMGWSMNARFMLVIENDCPGCKTKRLVVRASFNAAHGNFFGDNREGDGFNGFEPDGPDWRPDN